MKIEKTKHDHKLTHLLKVGIFAMLMIAPLFASCSQLMYVTFNKNAYQSSQIDGVEYYTDYEYQTNEVNNISDLVEGNIYHLQIINFNSTTANRIAFSEYYNLNISTCDDVIYTNSEIAFNMCPYFSLDNNYCSFWQYKTPTKVIGISRIICELDIVFSSIENLTDNNVSYLITASNYLGNETLEERPVQALDNAFYYGVEKMTESPLFNWTQNTALYTGIKAMTDNLQVQTNVIAVLVTYWTILTIIYIIIDIVLALFTKMTHLLVTSD